MLQTLSDKDISKYSALTTALELRFRDEHLKQVFTAPLKTRTQKVVESLPEFAADVKKMVRLAYSEAPPKLRRCYKYTYI